MQTKVHPTRRRNRKRAIPADRKAGIIAGKTIQELARERGAKPFDPNAFAHIVPPDEDIGAFVADLTRPDVTVPDLDRAPSFTGQARYASRGAQVRGSRHPACGRSERDPA